MEGGSWFRRLRAIQPDATTILNSVLLIRIFIAFVFVSEGIQKFLYPSNLGVGRFITIGIPAPEIMAPFVAVVEITCGTLILLGFLTRLAAVPLIIDMLVAIASTKLPMLMSRGFWAMAHEARTDFSMLLGLIFLVIVGSGKWSLNHWYANRKKKSGS